MRSISVCESCINVREKAMPLSSWLSPCSKCSGRFSSLVAHDCGYPLSRYTCRGTRVAADFLHFRAFCRCSTGVALHP